MDVRWLLVLLLSSGCRQLLGLDEGVVVEDAPPVVDVEIDMGTGHDEDLDQVGDEQDNCPATVNTDQAMVDDVGVACDPDPQTLGDRIALFLPFFPAGQPPVLTGIGRFEDDYVSMVEQDEIRTLEAFESYSVTADIERVSFVGTAASLELSIGVLTCRVETCGNSICLVADNGLVTSPVPLTMFAVDATLSLTQADGELECALTRGAGMPITTQLQGIGANERVRLKVEKATARIKNLTVYVVDP